MLTTIVCVLEEGVVSGEHRAQSSRLALCLFVVTLTVFLSSLALSVLCWEVGKLDKTVSKISPTSHTLRSYAAAPQSGLLNLGTIDIWAQITVCLVQGFEGCLAVSLLSTR